MKTGVQLIAEERKEQIKKHGWDLSHDQLHDRGELAKMAAILAVQDTDAKVHDIGDFSTGEGMWGLENKLSDNPIHRLKVAGALIAAEIDRLQYTTNEAAVGSTHSFSLEEENAIWGVIQHLSREQHKNPKRIWHRIEVFRMIQDELY